MVVETRSASPIFVDEEAGKNNSNVVYIRRHRHRIVLAGMAEKFSHLDWLLPLLPICHHYCEPFFRFWGCAALIGSHHQSRPTMTLMARL